VGGRRPRRFAPAERFAASAPCLPSQPPGLSVNGRGQGDAVSSQPGSAGLSCFPDPVGTGSGGSKPAEEGSLLSDGPSPVAEATGEPNPRPLQRSGWEVGSDRQFVSRPYGTCGYSPAPPPAVETAGYSQSSLTGLSALSCQLSAISRQLSAISYQLSAISRQNSGGSSRWSATKQQQGGKHCATAQNKNFLLA